MSEFPNKALVLSICETPAAPLRLTGQTREAVQLCIFRMPLPWTDFKPKIKQFIQAKWQEDWNTKTINKLHFVKPKLGPPTGRNLPRHGQTVLYRARIGHTSHSRLSAWKRVVGLLSVKCLICKKVYKRPGLSVLPVTLH